MRVAVYTALLSLLLVAAVVPDFAWPWHRCGGRFGANASAAIATLKNVASAQEQFRARIDVDRDGDGRGEYGYLAELAGAEPPLLSQRFAAVAGGRVRRSGYVFQVFLPGAGGGWLPEAPHGGLGAQPVDVDRAEREWLAYAWPLAAEEHGRRQRAFVCGADGRVLATEGEAERYVGGFGPSAGVAAHRYDGGRWRLVEGGADARGNVWVRVR